MHEKLGFSLIILNVCFILQASESETSDNIVRASSPKKVGRPPKKKRKSLDLNRTVLLSQMKERVEAAFVAQETESESNDDDLPLLNGHDKHLAEEEPLADAIPEAIPDVKAEEKPLVPSEESSNDAEEEGSSGKVNKNTILRNCFASLHRRQQMEKEQQYNHYLNE